MDHPFTHKIFSLGKHIAMLFSEDVLFDVLSYVSKNETEKCCLISKSWKKMIKKGMRGGVLIQERVFTKLFVSVWFHMQDFPLVETRWYKRYASIKSRPVKIISVLIFLDRQI
jgi:hypothetical protein